MGRRKITIRQIVDPKLRHITFNKRKNGLIKKAAELSLLCNVNMLLIFEDGNGNLIQFSKNKLTSIPAFFQECRYNNLLEFVAKDYPNFFKVNHYKKHKGKDMEDFDVEDFDPIDEGTSKTQSGSQNKFTKRPRLHGHIKEEDQDIYQSGSDDSDDDGIDELNTYSESQPNLMSKSKSFTKTIPKSLNNDEKSLKSVINKDDTNNTLTNQQETFTQSKEAFQPYKETNARLPRDEKTMDFPSQYAGFEQSFKRATQTPDVTNSQFRFYSGENPNINVVNAAANPFVSTPNYPPSHPYIHNNHGFPSGPNSFQTSKPTNRLRGFGNLNMSHMANEETLNAMLKGFNPLSFAMGGGNPFIGKQNTKPEIDEKMLDTANMIKYLNGTNAANYANSKLYNFHPTEVSKPDEAEVINHIRRNEHEGAGYDHEHEYHELPSYVRGDFRLENGIPQNLPSAYFSSKKFNFDGYFNTFEEDRFNEFGEAKKKLKQAP